MKVMLTMQKTSTTQTKEKFLTKHPFTRRDFLATSLKAGAAAFTTGLLPKLKTNAQGQYNVLFIIVDDLRPLLGCYGHSEIHTPNIDTLAQQGTLFNRAYCQFPLCNPSRASIFTGLRPKVTGVLNNRTDFQETLPNAVTLDQHFHQHGYQTFRIGKTLHAKDDTGRDTSWAALDVGDDELSDGKVARHAVEVLTDIKDKQFFLTIGFEKPHLPFHVPRKYYDLYNTDTLSLPATSKYPADSPYVARNNLDGLRAYDDISLPISDEKIIQLIRGYAASTSYVDAQIGHIFRQLDSLRLTERTIIILCGDHGFHLGEHGTWRKNTLFEVSLRSPLIIRVPGQTHPNTQAMGIVELIDLYPTLCDACELPIPPELEGLSLMPVIEQPNRPWKVAAYSSLERNRFVGNSMRTTRYRYTEWRIRIGPLNLCRDLCKELYDYETDPDETTNIANLPENADLVKRLSQRLRRARWEKNVADRQKLMPIPETLPWDVNDDGTVDIRDLILISSHFGSETPTYPKADANKDGKIDIIDLILVASHLGQSLKPAAPSTPEPLHPQHAALVNDWLTKARLTNDSSYIFKLGLTNLENLLNSVMPEKTMLLSNYPNPFNPETWIPYDLAEDAELHIHIYNLKGESIRKLDIGFQTAGTYRTPARSAHWDGRNTIGETVASGTYFYTLTARYNNSNRIITQFRNTRRMVIVK
ncbi:hypothetical protein C6496_10800 [Candidatus Poribacteria bacterium]|nr:MAG: hypothetical protein C6496_10800 [Candidatus Poribacteria bacterium]